MRSYLTKSQSQYGQMDKQTINSKLPLAFGQEILFGRKLQSNASTTELGQSAEVTEPPEQPASQKYFAPFTAVEGLCLQSREKLGEMLSALQNIVNLNSAISKNRLGKVGANVEKASKMVTQNGEKITKLIEDFHILLTLDSLVKEKQAVKITSLIETVVQTQCSFVGERGISLTCESEIDTCSSVHLSPQLLSFLLCQTIEKIVFSACVGAKINISLAPSHYDSKVDLHIIYSCPNQTLSANEPRSASPLRNESNLIYQKYGIISQLLNEYVDEINGKVSIRIHSDDYQQITLSLPIQTEKVAPLVVDLSLSREQNICSSIGDISPIMLLRLRPPLWPC